MGHTTSPNGAGYSTDGYTCGGADRYWVFYNDGTNYVWKWSTDGLNWTGPNIVPTTVPPPSPNDMAFLCSGGTVYFAGGKQSSSDSNFYVDSGTLSVNGTIAWGTESAVPTLGNTDRFPSIALDSSGNLWVAVQTQSGTGITYLEVWERTTTWTRTLLISSTSSPFPQLVALSSQKLALLYGTGSSSIELQTFDGHWSFRANTTATTYNPFTSAAVLTSSDTLQYCASDGLNVYLLSFQYSGTAWSSPRLISSGIACSASSDGASTLGLFYVLDGSDIRYVQSNDAGSTFMSPVVVSTSESGVNSIGASLLASTDPPNRVMAVWLSGRPSAGSVKFWGTSTAVTSISTSTTTLTSSTSVSTTTIYRTSTVTDTTTQFSTFTTTSVTTQTTTRTVTSTVTTPGGVPTASSLTCDTHPQVGHKLSCTDVVSSADQGVLTGTVTWTNSGSGSYSDMHCDSHANGNNGQLTCRADFVPASSGPQTLTATYSGDAYHTSSSASYTIFVGSSSGSRVTGTSVTCDDTYLNVGDHTNCHASVTTANGVTPTGSVTWSSTDHGTFSHANCNPHGDSGRMTCDVQYSPTEAGSQTIVGRYAGDSGHDASSGSFTVFVSNRSADAARQMAFFLSGGSVLGIGLSLVALEVRKGRDDKTQP